MGYIFHRIQTGMKLYGFYTKMHLNSLRYLLQLREDKFL